MVIFGESHERRGINSKSQSRICRSRRPRRSRGADRRHPQRASGGVPWTAAGEEADRFRRSGAFGPPAGGPLFAGGCDRRLLSISRRIRVAEMTSPILVDTHFILWVRV